MIEIAYVSAAKSTIIFFTVYKSWWRYLSNGDHLEDLNLDGRIILKFVFTKWDGGMDWIDPAHDRDR